MKHENLCVRNENCQCKTLLKALGSDDCFLLSTNVCCDCCHPVCPNQSLLLSSVTTEGRKRTIICLISADTKALLTSRHIDSAIERNPFLKMLPKSVVCPVTLITRYGSTLYIGIAQGVSLVYHT